MDRSKLPKMAKGKVVPIPKVIPQTPRKTNAKNKRGGVGGVLDAISKKNRMLKEAAGN